MAVVVMYENGGLLSSSEFVDCSDGNEVDCGENRSRARSEERIGWNIFVSSRRFNFMSIWSTSYALAIAFCCLSLLWSVEDGSRERIVE